VRERCELSLDRHGLAYVGDMGGGGERSRCGYGQSWVAPEQPLLREEFPRPKRDVAKLGRSEAGRSEPLVTLRRHERYRIDRPVGGC